MAKWEKALTNPYNPDNKKSKPYVSKKMHVTPPPVNELHLEDHERAHTGKANSKIDHGQGSENFTPVQKRLLAGELHTDPVYHRLSNALNKGLD